MGYSKSRESLEAGKEPPVRPYRNVDEREENDASIVLPEEPRGWKDRIQKKGWPRAGGT